MLARATASPPITWDEFVGLPDGDRRELIDGVLVEVEVPTEDHEYIVGVLCYFLWGWAFQHAGARVLASGYRVRIDDLRGVMPDAQLYVAGNPARREENGLVQGHPDLVVEVLSPSSVGVDRILKARWYGAIGTPEYWIVDPVARTVERYVLQGEKYLLADGATGDETFTPESLSGLEIPLARLFPPVAPS